MKCFKYLFFTLILQSLIFIPAKAEDIIIEGTSEDGQYTYKKVKDDPMGVRIYELENGLKVKTSVNRDEPRIQTMVSVRAGSKQDPQDNTGLAHYLEHMLFKGTDSLGTLDYEKEKHYLDQVDSLYEVYNQTEDSDKRAEIYSQIDSVSHLAAEYAIPNEFDMLISSLGGSGINAFTSTEQTAYIGEIPSNQLDNWARVEGERYRNPVMRMFHTELEVVYEEKNRSLDNDSRKVFDEMLAGLFQNHTYGTQTTLGSVEHLRNPSLKAIREYYDKYYVPNNMAIMLAGDFDPDEAVKTIDKHFSYMEPQEVPEFEFDDEEPADEPTEKTVVGPDPESVAIGFRLPGIDDEGTVTLEVLSDLLSNGEAGLIDINLNQQQKTLSAGSWTWIQEDYSLLNLNGRPRDEQSLEEVRDLLLEQLEKVKEGDFDEEILQAIVNNLRADRMRQYENNSFRTRQMASSFVLGLPWEDYVKQPERMAEITKDDVVAYANEYFTEDYVIVYKKEGEDTTSPHLEKPQITPIETDREERSPFYKSVVNNEPDPIEPVFLDFDEDITRFDVNGELPVYYVNNDENELFRLYYVLDMGRKHDLKMALAVRYLEYLGTDKYSPEEINREFYNLAGRYGISTGSDQMYVYVRGLESEFDETMELFHHLLANASPDEEALNDMIDGIMRERRDMKQRQSTILHRAMRSYATYGEDNPFTYRLSEEEMRDIEPAELTDYLYELLNYEHKVFYYGPSDEEKVSNSLSNIHPLPGGYSAYPDKKEFERREMNENRVYFIDYDMVQAEVVWINKSVDFNPDLIPNARMFNRYFGTGMSSIVFQQLREARALAYSTYSVFTTPGKKDEPHYILSYIGTQSDKLNEAITNMNELKADLSQSESRLENGRSALLNNLRTNRTTRQSILFAYDNAQKRGLDYDLNEMIFNAVHDITLEDITNFHENHYSDRNYYYLIIADEEKIDLDSLSEFGEPVQLELEDVFGY